MALAAGNPSQWYTKVISDGTTTVAEIQILPEPGEPWGAIGVVGRGVAKRRKGEPRQPELGTHLALARAFRDAADRYDAAIAKVWGEP